MDRFRNPNYRESSGRVSLYNGTATREFRVAVLMMFAVVGPKPDGHEIVFHDGDRGNARIDNINTPETHAPNEPKQSYGDEAVAYLASLIPPGTLVRLERDQEVPLVPATPAPAAATSSGQAGATTGIGANCDPSYPDVCIPSPPELDCKGHSLPDLPGVAARSAPVRWES